MAYQVKLIEEGLWHIFAKLFHYFHIHIKIWWLIKWRIKWLSDGLSN